MKPAWLQLADEYERAADHANVVTASIYLEFARRVRKLYQIERDYQHAKPQEEREP